MAHRTCADGGYGAIDLNVLKEPVVLVDDVLLHSHLAMNWTVLFDRIKTVLFDRIDPPSPLTTSPLFRSIGTFAWYCNCRVSGGSGLYRTPHMKLHV